MAVTRPCKFLFVMKPMPFDIKTNMISNEVRQLRYFFTLHIFFSNEIYRLYFYPTLAIFLISVISKLFESFGARLSLLLCFAIIKNYLTYDVNSTKENMRDNEKDWHWFMFSFQITNSIIYDIDNGSKMKLYTENNSRQLVELIKKGDGVLGQTKYRKIMIKLQKLKSDGNCKPGPKQFPLPKKKPKEKNDKARGEWVGGTHWPETCSQVALSIFSWQLGQWGW